MASKDNVRAGADRGLAQDTRRIARTIAPVSLMLMLCGLLAFALSGTHPIARATDLLTHPLLTFGLGDAHRPARWLSADGAMSLGLLGLIAAPFLTVSWIVIRQLRDRRWGEAALAACLVGILILSMIL